MKYYIIAGEASGDLHASYLMKAIKKRDPEADFRCWGGDLMAAQGGEIVKHYKELAFMGFVEVVSHLQTILNNLKICEIDILLYEPDAIILVDYPGFNLRIAKFAHEQGLKVFYYISPQVWAWKKNRVFKIKKYVDKMLVILPFEKDFYARYDYEVEYVGHPLPEEIEDKIASNAEKTDTFRQRHQLNDKPIVALLPGSRKQEIHKMLPEMLSVVKHFPDYQFVVSAVPNQKLELYQKILGKQNLPIVIDETYPLLLNARAALVTSGTATLETALLGIPEVVCYKGNPISYAIARLLIKNIRFISLVNLIMDKEIVKELIQGELNTQNLKQQLSALLQDGEQRQKMLQDYKELKENLGNAHASDNAAAIIAGTTAE